MTALYRAPLMLRAGFHALPPRQDNAFRTSPGQLLAIAEHRVKSAGSAPGQKPLIPVD